MFEDIIGESKREEKKKESVKIKSPVKNSENDSDIYKQQKDIWEWIKEQQDEDEDPFFFPIFWSWGGK